MNLRSIRKLFSRSPDTHRSVLFWHWPSAPDVKTVESEIDTILEGGIGGVLIDSPPSSHAADYLDDDWLSSLMAATSRARKRHDSVWIYDDLSSTQSPGKTKWLKKHPEHAASCLQFGHGTLDDATREYLDRNEPFALFVQQGMDYQSITLEALDGLPDSRTKLLFFHRHQSNIQYRFLRAASINAYLEDTYVPIQAQTKRFFGNTLGVILANNASLPAGPGMIPWDDDLADLFEQAHGYALIPVLPQLARSDGGSTLVRFHFWTMIEALFREGLTYTFQQWGEDHKIPSSGFFAGPTSLHRSIFETGSRMPLYARQPFPAIAMSVDTEETGYGDIEIKQAVSTQRQIGTRGVIGVYETPTEPLNIEGWRRLAYRHLALGVTYLTLDGSFARSGPDQAPLPHLMPGESGWPYAKEHFDRLARLSWIQSLGDSQCKVLMLLPNTSIQCTMTHDSFTAYSLSGHVWTFTRELLHHQIDFDYGDETLLGLHAHAEHDQIRVKDRSYSVVLMPPMTNLRSSTYALLQDFTISGGRLLAIGTVPYLLDGKPNEELAAFFEEYAVRVIQGVDLDDYSTVIEQLTAWDCRTVTATKSDHSTPTELLATRRTMDDLEFIHLTHVNHDASDIALEISTSIDGHVELWDHVSGTMTPICACSPEESFRVHDQWEALEARTYVFLPERLPEDETTAPGALIVERVLEPEWMATRLYGPATALTECRFAGHPWGTIEDARQNLAERLNSNPGGVIGHLEWRISNSTPEDGFDLNITLMPPANQVITFAQEILNQKNDSDIGFPGFVSYGLPKTESIQGVLCIEGQWKRIDEINAPLITPIAAIDETTGHRVPISVPMKPWRESGLEDFGHTVTYQTDIQGYERFDESPIYLEVAGLHSPAELRINDRIIDHIVWNPHRVDIRSVWTNGPLRIDLEVAGSWMNVLHPDLTPMEQGLDGPPRIVIHAHSASV
ncbi:MAG: hypothetical protein VCD00_07645 [Candidatus Hydrogenedentota bacterium]